MNRAWRRAGAVGRVCAGALVLAACGTGPVERGSTGAGVGAASGAAIGALFGGIGAIPGALLGGGFGAGTGLATDKDDIYLGKPVWERDGGG